MQIKLYTEEQVIKFINDNFDEGCSGIVGLTPIELPSDEEVEKWVVNHNYEFSRVDIQTTKWVIEQIKQQDK